MWTSKPNSMRPIMRKSKSTKQKIKSDPIQDLGRSMTTGKLRKIQKILQYKVIHVVKVQLLNDNYVEETRLITYIMSLEN